MKNKPSVSVVIPLYGNPHLDRFKLVMQSILGQNNVDVEIIIGGINQAHKITSLDNLPAAEIAHPTVRMGRILNRGLEMAEGEFTYVTDADIVLRNNNYLAELTRTLQNNGRFLKRPPMRRLLLEDFDWFKTLAVREGLERAISRLDYSIEFIAKPLGAHRPIVVFRKEENGRKKTFVIKEDDLFRYKASEKNKGLEPLYFSQDMHCGATFAPTKAFEDVGGYHTGFISWGVWDADIQWKLEHLGGMDIIPRESKFEVIHLDHSRGYFDKDKWIQDRVLQNRRKERGTALCIEEDKAKYAGGTKNAL